MSEYWTEKDVIENAILDLQHERDDLKAEIARRDEQIAELTATTHSQTLRNAELSRFVWWVFHVYARNVQELTSGITEACTYETEEKAEKGKYGLPIRCWKYVRYLEEYTAGIYNGTYLDSETSTGVKDPPAGHWKGCEDVHWDCRIAQLENAVRMLADKLLVSPVGFMSIQEYNELAKMVNKVLRINDFVGDSDHEHDDRIL